MKDKSLIISNEIYYPGILEDIKKSKDPFKPVFEAFTNALEAIKGNRATKAAKSITIQLYLVTGTVPDISYFDRIVIEDTGAGFNKENFERLNRYKDTRKGFANRGTGRIQLLHFFDAADYMSIFKDKTSYKQRIFTLSKRYVNSKNAIISSHHVKKIDSQSTRTSVTLRQLLDKKDEDAYNNLTAAVLKSKLISHYMMEFCTHRTSLPKISVCHFINGKLIDTVRICADDIPNIDAEMQITVPYYRLSKNGKDVEQTRKNEKLHLVSFAIEDTNLEKNEIKFTSKGEVVSDTKIELENLAPKDRLNGKRYLFLISGKYLDERDGNTRGVINIPTRDEFKSDVSESQELFEAEEIILEDIQEETNAAILKLYKEIKKKKDEKKHDVDKLKEMFLLNEETLKSIHFGLEESEEKILEKVYTADSKMDAKKDADIKKCIDSLDRLDPSIPEYKVKLDTIISELVKAIPLQNRTALTHYVARRKLVLDLFQKVIDRRLEIQNAGERNNDEALLHNVIFQQSNDNPEESALWLINEDFIYFKGTSDTKLKDLKIDGHKIFKEQVTAEEDEYLLSLGENRKIKRPDVLLFPTEGKCIIIEFKNPDVNVSEHLNQINRYASLMLNFTVDEFPIDTFYGYLIGEKLSADDIRSYDADFKHAYHFDYVFRPNKAVAGRDGHLDGSLYTEVIRYSTLLKRARTRNEIFIRKLTESQTHFDLSESMNILDNVLCSTGVNN